uniref:Solute carrier family 2, facilitated glucose transporter member 11 isoform X4 n=1 Tax=Callorhinus ursinus TaxID=34884 RepID=A0A3Q7PB99_CALUR|nr:solute carrier family 2, facilitated glucose transporter member 11 isoform X4 [Callorhinus ursinus]
MLEKCIQGRVLLLTICAAGIGGTFQFGYNLSIINAPTLHIQEFINETWWVRTGQPLPDHLVLLVWSLIVSLYPLGGLFGALLAGPLAVMLGRKKSLLVNNIFVVAAATLFGFSRRAGSFEMIVLGRLLMGVSAGSSWVTQGPGPCCWPAAWCLGCSSLPPSLCFLRAHATSSLTVETPRPACPAAAAGQRGRGGGVGGAGGGARRLRGPARAAPVGAVPGSRPAEAGDEPRGAGQCLGALRERLGEARRHVPRPGPGGCGPQATGSPRPSALGLQVYAYASSVFREAGIPEGKVQYAVLGTGSCELLAACLSCVLIERVGRRLLLIGGYSLMTCWGSIFTAALCLQSFFTWMPYLAMSCIFAFILSFGIGPGGIVPLSLYAFPRCLCLWDHLYWLLPP